MTVEQARIRAELMHTRRLAEEALIISLRHKARNSPDAAIWRNTYEELKARLEGINLMVQATA